MYRMKQTGRQTRLKTGDRQANIFGADQLPTKDRQTPELRPGDLCPVCGKNYIDFDGMLNLTCPECGSISVGCFT